MESGEDFIMRKFILYTNLSNMVMVIKFRRLRWACHVARMEGKSAVKILTGKRPLGTPRRRWEDNIRMDLKEIWLIRLRRETNGEPLSILHGTSRIHYQWS